MPHEFLSDEWFAAVEGLGPAPPAPDELLDAGAINIVVVRPDTADVAVHLAEGTFGRGLADDPSLTLRTTFDVAKTVFLTGDQHAAMSAFLAGQVSVQGDLTRLMAMHRTTPSPAQRDYARAILRLTSR